MKVHSRFKVAKWFLLFWCLFIGFGAVGGASCMLIKPDGSILQMNGMLPYFQVLPFAKQLFQNYVFSGWALLVVNGISNLTAAGLLLAGKKSGVVLGGLFGVTLMLWICIQFVIFPPNPLSTSYFIFGLIQAATGYVAYVFYMQEQFNFDTSAITGVGKNEKELVVYFSRMGYTEKVAYEIAGQSGASVYAISTSEPTAGTFGFWWCGRYAMHGWAMPVEPVSINLEGYDKVTICCPIWAFGPAAPVRGFCKAAAGKIKRVDYVFVHHMRCRFTSASKMLDALLGISHSGFRSICCRLGRCKEV